MNKYKYLAKNTLFLTISEFGSKFISFFLVPLYTAVLSTSEYGVVDIITTSVTLLMYIFTLNIGEAVFRFVFEEKEKSYVTLKIAMMVLSCGTICVFFCTVLFSKLSFIQDNSRVSWFIVLLFFAQSLETILFQYLRATDKVHIMAISSFASTLVRLITSIITLVLLNWGIYGYLSAMTGGPLVGSLIAISAVSMPNQVSVNRLDFFKIARSMIIFAIPTAISLLGWWINSSIDRYFVTWICGTALNGIYAVAYKIPSLLTMINNIFCQAWGISLVKEFDKDDSDGFFANTYNMYHLGLSCMCVVIIIMNVFCARILFQKEFFEAWKYSSILVLATMFTSMSVFLSSVFTSVKKTKYMAYPTVVGASVNVIFNFILIPRYLVYGAAIATLISSIVCWAMNMFFVKKFVTTRLNISRDIVIYILIMVQIVFDHANKHFYFGQVIILFSIAYLYRDLIKQFYYEIKNIITKKIGR